MRISDWSSDVCSSDLRAAECAGDAHADRFPELACQRAELFRTELRRQHLGEYARRVRRAEQLRTVVDGCVRAERCEQQQTARAAAQVETALVELGNDDDEQDRKSTRLNSSH